MARSPELLGRLDPAASSYLTALRERVLVYDGAMGTNLQLLGLSPEDFGGPELEGCNEVLIDSRPDLISQVHRSFYEVGSDVVETGTFGSSSVVLVEYGLEHEARRISRRGAELAKAVAAEFSTPERPRWVAGSMGPGTKFPTLGHISYADLRDAYEEQALGLLEGGADLLLIETVFDLLSAKSAINGARRAMVALDRIVPLQVQVTIELTGRMLPGTEIGAALTVLDAMQVDVVGLNCATGPVEMSEALRHLCAASRMPIACLPNAGLPSVVDGKMHYDLTPDQLAEHLHRFVTEFGVSAVGGCCGTTPEHLAAVVEACAGLGPTVRTPVHEPSAASIYTAVPFAQDTSYLAIGERTNANGSKKFREAMLEGDWDTCVAMAREQVTEGSHLIDVCVDYTGADGVADMHEVASRFATQASVPLVVDSTEGPVVRAALEWIGGRPVLNSVNLEEGDEPGTRLDTFLRLAREFGAAVVCTCIDEEGQARTAEWKLRAARNIRDIAVERYGLEPEDLLFDPLALPLSTGMEESRMDGIETIEGIRAIKAELPGVSTVLGLSNVSFGLNPAARQVLNSVFLHECVEAGLDSAIVHASKILPLARIDERAREISLDLVYNRRTDDYDPLQELLALFDGVKVNTGAQDDHADWPVDQRLSQRIIDGNRTGLDADLTEALDDGMPALGIVNDVLLEGMKVVGERFASGEMQLPFVLQSAETMKAAVAFLEPYMEKADQGGKGTVVLATVKGDVHDIGKNLVDIILTNNGYEVINLGIKIGINEMIVAAEEHKADAIGMSGLLVKSTLIMRENLVELNQRDLADFPILLGGAALTRTYVERDLREIYDGRLFYGRDAFEGLRTMDRLVELKKSGQEDATFGREISERNVPKRSRLDPQDTTPVEGQPARADVAADNPLFTPPFVGSRVAKGIAIDDIAEYLNLTALFRNQWGFRPENGENDTEFKTRVKATLRQELGKAKEGDLLIPQVAYGHFAANAEGNDLIIWKDESRTAEWMRFTFPRQRKEPWLCIADFFRPSDSGEEDFASFMLCTIGHRASEEAARLFAENEYQNYLFLHGLSVEMAEATAEYWHHRIRQELGFAGEDGPSLAGLFRQTYRGGRYSWGYPACPDLTDNAKVVELLGGERVGVTVSEGFQLHPEQTTDAIICHHPEAKYFVA
jgi:5-methyltetrahydrofolate--homocysteine methyltransferase